MPSAGAQSLLVKPRREIQLQLLCKPQALSLSASGLSEGHTSLPATERLLQLGGDAQTSESERQALGSGSGTCCQHAPGPVADPLEASVSPPVKLGSSWISLTEIPFRNAPEECLARNRRTAPGVLVWTLPAVCPVPQATPRSPLLRPRGYNPKARHPPSCLPLAVPTVSARTLDRKQRTRQTDPLLFPRANLRNGKASSICTPWSQMLSRPLTGNDAGNPKGRGLEPDASLCEKPFHASPARRRLPGRPGSPGCHLARPSREHCSVSVLLRLLR